MELVVATGNPHKVDEIRAILAPHGVRVLGLDDLGASVPEPDEPGDTFEENAAIKARAYAAALGRTVLADDSGLEVDALGGRPGVHSARYAGIGSTREERDAANNARLLRELAGVPAAQRTARFVCAICVASADGRVLATSRGAFDGVIIESGRGSHGFGYDPLLFVPDAGCTSAELDPAEKNRRSHRGQAVKALVPMLPGLV
jgi:XTP/dITP diphosphohydrolase